MSRQTRHRLDELVRAAVADGLLPAGTGAAAPAEQRPWPVVLLTGLGAWLAAIPLTLVVGTLLGPILEAGLGPYVAGGLLLAGALVVLRSADVALFVEQLAVPVLLVGGGALGFGLVRDLPRQAAAAVLLVLMLAIAALVAHAWLRTLLGAAAAVLGGLALLPDPAWAQALSPALAGWLAWHGVLLAWAGTIVLQDRATWPRQAAAVEAAAAGWIVATLAALALFAGSTFLVGAFTGGAVPAGAGAAGGALGWQRTAPQVASAAFGLAAAAVVAARWPGLRQPAAAGLALLLAALGAFMPALGGALFALALCATRRRWALAGAAAVSAAWIVGAFYYQLQWPLATKALVLVAAGGVAGALAWWAHRSPGGASPAPRARGRGAAAAGPRWPAALLALAAVATLATVNVAIGQKEQLIATGRPVFVALAPVDPRSLMQGDYMRLEFVLPPALRASLDKVDSSERPKVVARLDERGIATIVRRAEVGAGPGPGEVLLELTPKGGRWIVVTDAWFFAEGEAPRWQRARFGEFRVDARGRALLVGLRGEDLRPL
jgi:hypothetical protein